MWHEHGIDITSHAGSVIGHGHSGAADNEYIGDDAPAGQALAERGEGSLDLGPAKQTLAKLAVDRDATRPGKSVVDDSTDALVAAVPTEALAAYTAVIGVVLAANIGSAYALFRWCAYATFIALAVLAPLSLFKQRSAASTMESRKLPIPKCLTAGAAAAAWGLVMPGNPLTLIIQGNALVFATTAILVGTVAVLGLATKWLGTANSKNAPQTASGLGSGHRAAVMDRPDGKPSPVTSLAAATAKDR
jgi:hypothetical protein